MIKLTRVRDWKPRLTAHLRSVRDKPFAWGDHDCLTFAADCVDLQCGSDIAAVFRGKYVDCKTATAHLRSLGHGSVPAAIASVLPEEVAPLWARRGDVVARRENGRWCSGVLFGSRAWFLVGDGLAPLPLDTIERAWKVGE